MRWRLLFGSAGVLLALGLIGLTGDVVIERRWPPVGSFIEVGGHRLHYVEAGQGPPVILVHGASANLRDMQASLLPALADTHTVLAFDRPGYGYSDRGRRWPSPADQARLFVSAAEQLGHAQPLIVGHSWAGAVVMAALLEVPERVAGGVLLSGAVGHWAGSAGWIHELARLPLIGPVFAHTLLLPAGAVMIDGAIASVFAPNPVPEGYAGRTGAPLALRAGTFLHNGEDMERLNGYLQTLSRDYRDIRKPLLAIHGTADKLVPYWNHGRRLEPVVPGFRRCLLDGIGHAPHHAATAEVAAAIRRFALAPPAPHAAADRLDLEGCRGADDPRRASGLAPPT